MTAATARSGQPLPVPKTPSAAANTAKLPVAPLRLHRHIERMLELLLNFARQRPGSCASAGREAPLSLLQCTGGSGVQQPLE